MNNHSLCIIRSKHSSITEQNLFIYVISATPVITYISESDEVQEGVTVNISCNASGIPEPSIYWKRMNNMPLPMGGTKYEYVVKVKRQKQISRFCTYVHVFKDWLLLIINK